jgi:PsbN protein
MGLYKPIGRLNRLKQVFLNWRIFLLILILEKKLMESPAFFFTFFLWFLLLSVTGYSVYVSFGPPSKKLRDPFEEHED